MKEGLSQTLCAVHPERPATARCPSCRGFFCGECITEHHGKLVCASCLAAQIAGEGGRGPRPGRRRLYPAAWLQAALAAVMVWVVWQAVADFISRIPDTFHDGTIWE